LRQVRERGKKKKKRDLLGLAHGEGGLKVKRNAQTSEGREIGTGEGGGAKKDSRTIEI